MESPAASEAAVVLIPTGGYRTADAGRVGNLSQRRGKEVRSAMTPSAIQVLIRGEVPQQLSLLELAVTYELNRHASLLSRFRQLPGSRHMVEDDFGAPVEVVARDEDGTSLTLFRGLVRRVDVEHELSGAGNLIYHGVSETWLDDVTTRSRIFRKKTVDAILRELAIHSKPRRDRKSVV